VTPECRAASQATGGVSGATPISSVLLIDDDQSSCAAVAALLRREGVRGDLRARRNAGIVAPRQSPPALIVLDLEMPRTVELDLIDALMEEPRFADIPVVIFCGRCDPGTVAEARGRGARDSVQNGASWDQVRD
jgi:CheY-like chemotaxis protein